MAAELVETSRLWARTVARIEPEWAEELGRPPGQAQLQRAALVDARGARPWPRAGHPLRAARSSTDRQVPLRPASTPSTARELFLRHALVEGDWHAPPPRSSADNRALLERGRGARATGSGAATCSSTTTALDRLYDERVPAGGHLGPALRPLVEATSGATEPDLLTFTVDHLVDPAAGARRAAAFPDTWRSGDLELALSPTRSSPARPTTASPSTSPSPSSTRSTADRFDWQVPGLREELVTALIRSLPKALRRSFVPAPDHVPGGFLRRSGPTDGPLLEPLARELRPGRPASPSRPAAGTSTGCPPTCA